MTAKEARELTSEGLKKNKQIEVNNAPEDIDKLSCLIKKAAAEGKYEFFIPDYRLCTSVIIMHFEKRGFKFSKEEYFGYADGKKNLYYGPKISWSVK